MLVEMKIDASTIENSMQFLLKTGVTVWSKILIPAPISKNLRTVIWKDICIPMFIAALFIISQDMEAA